MVTQFHATISYGVTLPLSFKLSKYESKSWNYYLLEYEFVGVIYSDHNTDPIPGIPPFWKQYLAASRGGYSLCEGDG